MRLIIYFVVTVAIVLTGMQMMLSIKHSQDGADLEVVDQRIQDVNAEVIVSRERIALYRSAEYIRFVSSERLGMKENAAKQIHIKVSYPENINLPEEDND